MERITGIIRRNELYLAQSISTKLNQSGYETEIFSSVTRGYGEQFGRCLSTIY